MASGRGGPRHKSNPYIETGLLMKLLMGHEELLVNFKGYETRSRNNGVDPQGLIHALDFINDVLELEPTAEVHPQPLRNSLLGMLTQKPQLNNTCQSGSLWVHMRSERINVVLFHIRKLARTGPTQACVNALSGLELTKLQNTLRKVVLQEDDTALPLEDGKTTPLEKGEVKQEVAGSNKKKLKMAPSDVSMDSHGFPAMLKSPKEDKANEGKGAGPSRLLKKRVGQAQQIAEVEADPGLRSKLGLERKKMSRPAAVKEKRQQRLHSKGLLSLQKGPRKKQPSPHWKAKGHG